MTPSQAIAIKTYKECLSKMGTVLAVIKPREEEKPTGKHGELQIVTDGYDGFLDSGEKSAAFEIAAVLKLYRMMPGEAK